MNPYQELMKVIDVDLSSVTLKNGIDYRRNDASRTFDDVIQIPSRKHNSEKIHFIKITSMFVASNGACEGLKLEGILNVRNTDIILQKFL